MPRSGTQLRNLVTQFGLILALEFCGLVFALVLSRVLAARDVGGAELRRISSALARAVDAFVQEELRLIAVAAGVLAAVSFGAHAALAPAGAVLSRLEVAFWAALGLGSGAACGALVARLSARNALGTSLRVLQSAGTSMDAALAAGMRGAGATALFAEVVSVIGLALPFSLLYAMKGGFSAEAPVAADLYIAVAAVSPGFALGACISALIVQRAGSVFHNAGDIAADLAGERDAGLEHDDVKNPAVVADLVGDYVGVAARRAVDLFTSATLTNVTILLVGAALVKQHREAPLAILPVVFLPALVRAFSGVSGAFAVMTVRTDESSDVATGLWRGQVTNALVTLGALFGAAHWLLGNRASHFVLAGAVGIVGLSLSSHIARLRSDKRFPALRDTSEAMRVGDAAAIAQGLSSGLRASALPMLVIGASVGAAALITSRSDVPLSGVVGVVLVLAAVSCTNPYALALGSFGAIVDAARGVGAIAPTASSPEAARRAARLDDAGFAGSAMAQAHLFAVAGLSAVTAAVAVASSNTEAVVNVLHPVVLWCGALGFGVALAYAGDTLRHGVSNARGVTLEVERQLRAFPRERGRTRVPADFSPSYKACLDLSLSGAFRRILPKVFAVVATPLLLLALLRVVLTKAEPALASQGLVALLLVAGVSALALGLAGEGTRVTLAASRRNARPNTPRADVEAALGCDAFADAVGHGAAPAALLAVQACAATTLAAFSLVFP
mgnify:CR=1 FL=1